MLDKQEHPIVATLASRDSGLAARAARLIQESHLYLELATSSFPSGTDHTPKHTTTVERIGAMLLGDALISELSSLELFYLALACHYHDLGMVGRAADDSDEDSRQQTRRDHAIRVGDVIKTHWQELGFESFREADVLAEICRGHRPTRIGDEATWEELKETAIPRAFESVRLRVLAAMIFAIDELDISADRANEKIRRFRAIEDAESFPHWFRHQAIFGPAPMNGALCYEVRIESPAIEKDIRSRVLKKAISARSDLVKQLKLSGLASDPLPIVIDWTLEPQWKLLVTTAISDSKPRTESDVISETCGLYDKLVANRVDLSQYCTEINGDRPSQERDIRRALADLEKFGFIANDGHGHLSLATNSRASQLFELCRQIDVKEERLIGRFRTRWEPQLLRSNFGRAFIENTLYPQIDCAYSVQVARLSPDDPVKVLLSRCPSAHRVALQYKPLSSAIVKAPLLASAVLTGTLFELYDNPEIILDPSIRHAVWKMVGGQERLQQQVRLFEEIALLGRHSLEQLVDFLVPSPAQRDQMESHTGEQPAESMTISQTIPKEAASLLPSFWVLIAASRRAEVSVQLAPESGCALTVHKESDQGIPDEISYIEFGPTKASRVKRIDVTARVMVDVHTSTIQVFTNPLKNQSDDYPVVVGMPLTSDGKEAFNWSGHILWHRATVDDLRHIVAANRLVSAQQTSVDLFLDGSPPKIFGTLLAGGDNSQLFQTGIWDEESIKALDGLDGRLPAPMFIKREKLVEIAQMEEQARAAYWQAVRDGESAKSVYSIVISELAHDYEEKIVSPKLIALSKGVLFSPPSVKSSGEFDHEAFERQWRLGSERIEMSSYYTTDVLTLAAELDVWARHNREPFPFSMASAKVDHPTSRSLMRFIAEKEIDRVWHRMRPFVIRFRPTTRAEAYSMEAKFWTEQGDELRAMLAQEIADREAQKSKAEAKPIAKDSKDVHVTPESVDGSTDLDQS